MLAIATARKRCVQAFSFSGVGSAISRHRPSISKRLFGSADSAAEPSNASTPPESPLPPPGEDDLVSFYLLRHGQTNFNAIGRIQVGLYMRVL